MVLKNVVRCPKVQLYYHTSLYDAKETDTSVLLVSQVRLSTNFKKPRGAATM